MSKKHYAYYDAPKSPGNHHYERAEVMSHSHLLPVSARPADKCTSRPIRLGTVERTSKSRSFVPKKSEVSVYWDTKEDAEGNIVEFKRKLNFKSHRNNVVTWTP